MSNKVTFSVDKRVVYVVAAFLLVLFAVFNISIGSQLENNLSYKSRASSPKLTPIPSPTVALPEYYVKTSEWTNADPNIAVTVMHGCNPGDIAVGGGMDGYNGPINVWRTVRNGPSNSTGSNGWQTTVINQSSVMYQFTVSAKCLKLVR